MIPSLKKLWPVALILVVVLISYGQTLRMYFWQDDSALIFKLQNPEGPAGSFGTGLWERGGYQYLVVPFVPFYPLFGLEPFGYFLVGFLTYVLATAAFWLFVKKLFNEKRAAYIAILIFAAGYIGSDIMFRIINSWQTNMGLILTFLMLERYTDFLKTRDIKSYFLAIVLYWLNTELVFIRSHSLILPILVLDLALSGKFGVKSLGRIALRQIPFWIIFKIRYLSDPGFGAPGITKLIREVLINGEVEKLSVLFANIGNVFIPSNLQEIFISKTTTDVYFASFFIFLIFALILHLTKKKLHIGHLGLIGGLVFNFILYEKGAHWYQDVASVVSGLIGIEIMVLTIISRSPILIFAFIFVASQVFGYYIQYPTSILSTTHRYFSYALIGYAIFIGWLVSRTKLKPVGYLLLLAVVVPNLFLGSTYQAKIVSERSTPTRKFYQDLKKFVPNINKGDVFYFDVSREGAIPIQFGDFFSVGSMPETTALAIYYGVDRYDVSMFTEFDELASKLASGEVKVSQVHSFFYGKNGLIQTTDQMRSILSTGAKEAKPIAPILAEVWLAASLAPQEAVLPQKKSFEERKNILEYLVERKSYYEKVRVSSSSEWKYREVGNVADRDFATVWQGHRLFWHNNQDEILTVDIGSIKKIDRVFFTVWKNSLSPTKYKIYVSQDGQGWKEVKNVDDPEGKKDGEVVVEDFEPTMARFLRIDFDETLLRDSPAIVELEVVEERFKDVDPSFAWKVEAAPLSLIGVGEQDMLIPLIKPLATLTANWETDKRDQYASSKTIPLTLELFKKYDIVIPAGGTDLTNFKLESNISAKLSVGKIKMRNLSIQELIDRGLIRQFSEN